MLKSIRFTALVITLLTAGTLMGCSANEKTTSDKGDAVALDATTAANPFCGDGACNGDESTANCGQDCGTQCGDGTCNGDEKSPNCPADCGSSCSGCCRYFNSFDKQTV